MLPLFRRPSGRAAAPAPCLRARAAAAAEALEARQLLSAALVSDINTAPAGPSVNGPVRVGDAAYFVSHGDDTGAELWRTDGTAAGTRLVKDIVPGPLSAGPENLTAVGAALYFTADDGVSGTELWKTDGTAAGTVMVRDLTPGPAGSEIDALAPFAGGLLFTGPGESLGGTALWRSDGTAAGTAPLKTFGTADGRPGRGAVLGGHYYFRAPAAGAGEELWKTDGTAAGTVLVKDVNPGAASSFPSNLRAVGGRLFFTAGSAASWPGQELWVSDGTANGTRIVKDLTPTAAGLEFAEFVAHGGVLYFRAGASRTAPSTLYRSDGTADGTREVRPLATPNAFGGMLASSGGALYFIADRGQELWRGDGTVAGSTLVRRFDAGASAMAPVSNLRDAGNGRLVFRATDPAGGSEPWVTDGTPGGTARLADLNPGPAGSSPHSAVPLADGRVVLFALGAAVPGLYAADVAAAPQTAALLHRTRPTVGSYPDSITPLSGRTVVFRAIDESDGRDLWRSDGTAAGTYLLHDFAPDPAHGAFTVHPAANGRAILSVVTHPGPAYELWSTDGTREGTVKLPPPRDVRARAAHQGSLYFVSDDGNLWKTDGTAAGTTTIKVLPPDVIFSRLVSDGATLYLVGRTRFEERGQLWKSDGTEAGTFMFAETPAEPDSFTPVAGGVYFDVYRPTRQLWKSDGTAAGTVPVTTLPQAIDHAVAFRGQFFFVGTDPQHRSEIWKSDGTAAGTVRVTDVEPAAMNPFILDVAVAGDWLYFSTYEGLYRTDGTAAGTAAVPAATGERLPVVGFPLSGGLTVAGGTLFATAGEAYSGSGEELWRTTADGASLVRVADIAPGDAPAEIESLVAAGDAVYFSADDGQHGSELWTALATPPAPLVTGAHAFYNNSTLDGRTPAAAMGDLNAIAADKRPLRPGEAASTANVTHYSRGINGVIVDFLGAPPRELTAADFDFRAGCTGDPSAWPAAAQPSVTLLPAWRAGPASARYALTWPDGAAANTWLRVTVKANANTGLAAPDVFYFGNLVGDIGGRGAPTVDAADLARTRAAVGKTSAAALANYDFNRDGAITAADALLVRTNQRRSLPLFTAPSAAAAATTQARGPAGQFTPAPPPPRSSSRPPRRGLFDDTLPAVPGE